MNTPKDYQESILLEILAYEHYKAVSDARHLMDDTALLMKEHRFLSALDCLWMAIEELAMAHLITKSVVFDDFNVEKWQWFRQAFHN